ncbi:radical SAM protein [Candidatus Woesearchaeota archaeon]|nr:radical SAM protein [Candidatus Woesearchaeota archaeon]
MASLHYQMLDFWEDGDTVRINLSKRFYTYIKKEELEAIAPFKVERHTLTFDCSQQRAEQRFLNLLGQKMPELKTIVTNNKAVYIHKNSGIPLIGNLSFGIIHRGTSIIEIKPQTSCNLDCVYCSVNEGLSSNQTDYFVEREYLMDEFKRVAEFVNIPVEAHIGVQGEPLVYAEFAELAEELSALPYVYRITTDTNGTLLNKPLIDKLATIPKLRLNVSLNAVDKEIASKMAGTTYNTIHVMNMIKYAAEKMDVLVAPLYVPGYNDNELLKVIEFAKTLPPKDYPMVGIQNFLNYTTGRNPTKQLDWEPFMAMLRDLEKKTGMRLILDFKKDFHIDQTKQLPKPFKKGKSVFAKIVAPGRYPKTKLAVAGDRTITVFDCDALVGKEVKVKILRSKHNVYFGKEV